MLVSKLLLSYFSECLNIYSKSSTGRAHIWIIFQYIVSFWMFYLLSPGQKMVSIDFYIKKSRNALICFFQGCWTCLSLCGGAFKDIISDLTQFLRSSALTSQTCFKDSVSLVIQSLLKHSNSQCLQLHFLWQGLGL